MRKLLAQLTVTLCLAVAVGIFVADASQPPRPAPRPDTSLYLSGKGAKEITIRTSEGQVLSVLRVPEGIALSVHGFAPRARAEGEPVIFEGDVNIRTKPEKELKQGALYGQMMASPFSLDVKDAVVEVSGRK